MGASSITIELKTRFNAIWNNAHPVAYPNVSFVPVVGTTWVRISIITTETRVVDIGSSIKTHRTAGILTIQLFVPKGDGDGDALAIAEVIKLIFNNWAGATVKCRASSVRTIGEGDNDDWYQVNITTPFVQDELI